MPLLPIILAAAAAVIYVLTNCYDVGFFVGNGEGEWV